MKGINAIALALTATTASASLTPHFFKRATTSLPAVSVQGNGRITSTYCRSGEH